MFAALCLFFASATRVSCIHFFRAPRKKEKKDTKEFSVETCVLRLPVALFLVAACADKKDRVGVFALVRISRIRTRTLKRSSFVD